MTYFRRLRVRGFAGASCLPLLGWVGLTWVGLAGCDPTDRAAGTGTGTGGEEGRACVSPTEGVRCKGDDACRLANDCCSCFAYNPNNSVPGNCGGSCEQ